MFTLLTDRLIFAAPEPSYHAGSYQNHLCYIPRNDAILGLSTNDVGDFGDIPCLWLPAEKAATVVIYFHANAEDLGMSFMAMRHMRDQLQVNVLAMEYPGYGLLNGISPSEDGIYCAALTVFRYLVDEVKVSYERIVFLGRSLGSGPAVHLASKYPIGGLILINAFATLRAAVRGLAGQTLAWMFRDNFNNERFMPNVSCPTLFIHGSRDRLVPAEHSVRLFHKCRARKLLVTPPRMEHNSHLFADPGFLAVPAIHFFCFPGYRTEKPPQIPAELFKAPTKPSKKTDQEAASAGGGWLGCANASCLAHCDRAGHDIDVPTLMSADECSPDPVIPASTRESGDEDSRVNALFAKRMFSPSGGSSESIGKFTGVTLANKADKWLRPTGPAQSSESGGDRLSARDESTAKDDAVGGSEIGVSNHCVESTSL